MYNFIFPGHLCSAPVPWSPEHIVTAYVLSNMHMQFYDYASCMSLSTICCHGPSWPCRGQKALPSQQWGHWKIPWVLRASHDACTLRVYVCTKICRLDFYSLSLVQIFETWSMRQNASRLVSMHITTHDEFWMSLFAGPQSKTPSRNTKATGLHWTFWWDCQTSNIVSTPNTHLLWPPSSIPTPDSWRAVETVCSVLLETTPRIMPAWPQKVCLWVRLSWRKVWEKASWNLLKMVLSILFFGQTMEKNAFA